MREFSLMERAEILVLAKKCSENLAAQPLIDYFNKHYRTKFENNGTTIADSIINKYFPDCDEMFRETIHEIMIQYVFDFESILSETDTLTEDKIIKVLEKYLENKSYLYYDQGMYLKWINKDELINLIVTDLLNDAYNEEEITEVKSCGYGN
jgi:hypothetical protein